MIWKSMLLGEICQITNGNSIPVKIKEKKFTGISGMPYIATKDVSFDGDVNYDNGISISDDQLKRFKIAPKESILICAEGGSAGRKIAYIDRNCCFVNKLFSIKPSSKILPKFVFYYLKSKFFQSQFKKSLTGLIGGVSLSKIKKFQIRFPELIKDQEKIIAKLDNAFAEIDKLKEDSNSRSRNSAKVFDNYLSKIFKEKNSTWVKDSLKNISLKIGSGATPKGGKDAYKKDGISLIRSMNVRDFFFKEKDLAKIDNEQANKLANVEVKNNDVLLNITGASVARCCLVENKYLPARVNQHVSIIRLKEKTIIPRFLMYGLVSKPYKDKLLQVGESSGATRQAITKKQIEEFQFRYPKDLEFQRRIIEKLDAISNLSLKLEKIYDNQIRHYEALKLALLSMELKSEPL